MTLLEETQQAVQKFQYYRYPNIDSWIEKIDEILLAIHKPRIGQDTLEEITLDDNYLTIHTSYSVRCCEQNNRMEIPLFILASKNPIKIAKNHYLENQMKEVQLEVEKAEKNLVYAKKKLLNIQSIYKGEIK